MPDVQARLETCGAEDSGRSRDKFKDFIAIEIDGGMPSHRPEPPPGGSTFYIQGWVWILGLRRAGLSRIPPAPAARF